MNDYSTREAVAIARHVKAALLHLRQAEDVAEGAGIDLHDYRDTGPAGLFRSAGEAVQELDRWAIESAPLPAETYQHTERWCHAAGGQMPATSWPAQPSAEAGRGMLAPDAVATYAAMLEATEPDPAGREQLRGELAALATERQGWEEAARACVCSPTECTRAEFRDHQGDSPGCMVCADLDPEQPCYAAVSARLVPLESEGLRQVAAYLDQADAQGPEQGVVWDTAKEAASAALRLPRVHGSQARFVPDLEPSGFDPWPVSTHTVVRVEAWAVDTSEASCAAVEQSLTTLAGVFDHGRFTDYAEMERQGGRRPYAWVLLRQAKGSFCDHTRERFSKGSRL